MGAEAAVSVLTNCLRTPQGSQSLRPIQAVALKEGYENNGLYLNARVGAGKTLVSGLIPTLMRNKGFRRPLVLVPASLKAKTEHEFAEMRRDWQVSTDYRLESYTALTRESNANLLTNHRPDLIICDEADALRRLKDSAAPKRLQRWREEAPQTAFFFMSGTFLKSRITDYSHLLAWALGERSPLPVDPNEIEQWSLAIDDADLSGLVTFQKHFPDSPVQSYDHAKQLYRERLRGAPGVIISDDQFTGSQLLVRAVYADPGLQEEFRLLRTKYQRPDGWDLVDEATDEPPDFAQSGSIWNVARQLALGFYYSCDPRPPEAWMQARRAWFQFVRAVLQTPGSGLDTEKQVSLACEQGAQVPEEWSTWRDLKPTFKPQVKPVWLHRQALDYARAWGEQSPGIIWVDHPAFGQRLSAETGWRYFGQGGLDPTGLMIDLAPTNRTIIASRLANQKGRNLQAWNRNLCMAAPNAARDGEQLFGRTHRDGQLQPWVSFDFWCACLEHENALRNLRLGAAHAFDTQGLSQKILATETAYSGHRPEASWAFHSRAD